MATPNVDAVRPLVMAIPAAEVRTYTAADKDLDSTGRSSIKLLNPARREALAGIGFPVDSLGVIVTLADALTELKGEVGADAAPRVGSARAAAVRRATPVRDHLVRACRYYLRHLGGIDVQLDAIREATGALDLASDLFVLAALVEGNAAAFAPNPAFNAAAEAEAARAAARDIQAVVSDIDAAEIDSPEVDLRNRVFTMLRRKLRDAAAACEFALPNDTELLERFARTR